MRQVTQSEINKANLVDENKTCIIPNLDLDETERVQEVDALDNPDDGLREIGRFISTKRDCEGLVPTSHRVGTLLKYPEWKIQWEIHEINLGACRIAKTKIPILHTRTTKKVLYCLILSPEDAQTLLERLFINCMKESAIVGGLLLLVTGGNFATALNAFKLSMKACLSTRVPDSIKHCLIPDLAILTEKGKWDRAM